MCANYIPTSRDQLAQYFGVDPREYEFKPETYPGYLAPMIRLSHDNPLSGQLEVVSAMFGMVPHWADVKLARQTYNSRSETTAVKPAFRSAWKRGQFCVIPVDSIYEPSYETGKPVRWRIRHADGRAMGVAGIWEFKADGPRGAPLLSFSMLTVNADDDPLMKKFHKPTDEKRSVVFLHPDQHESWIHSTPEQAPSFLKLYPADELTAAPAPRPTASRTRSTTDAADFFE
jgi:putative SOS response-associated peptidase YedK